MTTEPGFPGTHTVASRPSRTYWRAASNMVTVWAIVAISEPGTFSG